MKHNFKFIYLCGLQAFKLNKSLDIRMYSDCLFVREVNTFFKHTEYYKIMITVKE